MLAMQAYFIVDGILILVKFFFRISVVSPIFSYSKVFNIGNFVSLLYRKVRGIWLV